MHSHIQTWDNYREFADERGWLVTTILKQWTNLNGKAALDFGCGAGGTARALSQCGAKVTAVDSNPELGDSFKNTGIRFIDAKDEESYFRNQCYDIVILQDVLEHLPHPDRTMNQVKKTLKHDGMIFISTPNRFSVINLVSDPHWNLPLVALFPRVMVKLLVQKIFRRDLRQRSDWAALLSLKKLRTIIEANNLHLIFVNTIIARFLFQNPRAVVCHPRHLQLVEWMKRHRFDRWVYRFVNDRIGIFNFLINPTWYVIGKAR